MDKNTLYTGYFTPHPFEESIHTLDMFVEEYIYSVMCQTELIYSEGTFYYPKRVNKPPATSPKKGSIFTKSGICVVQ